MAYREFPEAVEWARDALTDLLLSMEDYELIDLQNKTGNTPEIWSMSQFDEIAGDLTPTEIVESIGPEFNVNDEWFLTDREDLFESFNTLDEAGDIINIEAIVEDILHDMSSYGNDEVKEILQEVMEGSY